MKRLVFYYLRKLSNKTKFTLDKLLLDSASSPFTFIILATALLIGQMVLFLLIDDAEKHTTFFSGIQMIADKPIRVGDFRLRNLIVFHTFDNSSINFTVMLRAEEYFNRFFIKPEFIKALHKRFCEERIAIPYAISAINLVQEVAESIRSLESQ